MSRQLRTIVPLALAAFFVTSVAFAQTTDEQPGPFDQEANYDVALGRIFRVKATGLFTFFPPAPDEEDETGSESAGLLQMGDFAAILMSQSDEESPALMAAGAWMGLSFDGFTLFYAMADSVDGTTPEDPANPEEELAEDEQTDESTTVEDTNSQQDETNGPPDVTAFGFAFGDFLFGNASIRNDAALRAHHCLLIGSLAASSTETPDETEAVDEPVDETVEGDEGFPPTE